MIPGHREASKPPGRPLLSPYCSERVSHTVCREGRKRSQFTQSDHFTFHMERHAMSRKINVPYSLLYIQLISKGEEYETRRHVLNNSIIYNVHTCCEHDIRADSLENPTQIITALGSDYAVSISGSSESCLGNLVCESKERLRLCDIVFKLWLQCTV